MKSSLLSSLLCSLLLAGPSLGQTNQEELLTHPEYTSSNYLVYPTPESSAQKTKPPKGFKPFYISHYGRHGSRYYHNSEDYNFIFETLKKADSAKVLTLDGKRLMIAAQILSQKAAPRAGDLTQVGAAQHEGIAKRMVKNFPELFKPRKVNGKKIPAHVDAYASTSGRCIVSMSAFTAALRAQAPDVEIRYESGKSLMDFICPFNWNDLEYSKAKKYTAQSDSLWAQVNPLPLMNKLFSDSLYVSNNINANKFYNNLFEITNTIQGMDEPLKETIHANLCNVKTGKCNDILDSLFTPEESILRWKAQNSWWYSLLGTSPLQETTHGTDFAKGTLENILQEASRAIAQENTAATLRFGHDTGLLPLAGLMELSIANAKVDDLKKLHEQWTDFRIIPMAANLQIVFYKKTSKPIKKKKTQNAKDEILVKFLYNEQEVTAPIPCEIPAETAKNTKQKCPAEPFYRWEDVKNFYKSKL